MKILAFLQNQWFHNPEAIKAQFARRPEMRNALIGTYLFMGCLTGRRLAAALGDDLCDQIIWEECSPEIGGKSSAAFPADLKHIRHAITEHMPDLILAFGKLAGDALRTLKPSQPVIYGPHPAARFGAIEGLNTLAKELTAKLAPAPGSQEEGK